MKYSQILTSLFYLAGAVALNAQITVDSAGKVAVGYTGAISNQMLVYTDLSDPAQHEQFNVYQLYGISSTDTDYIKAIDIEKYFYDIPAGVTSNGYQIGLATQVFVSDSNFEGVIGSQYGIWSRTGINVAGSTGERRINNAYGIYLEGLSGAGAITNHYGVYQTGTGTKNFFQGHVGIGASPVLGKKLTVQDTNPGVVSLKGNTAGYSAFLGGVYSVESNIDYRGRGVFMPSAAKESSDSWYAGVPYTGSGFQIGNSDVHTLETLNGPYVKSNARLFIQPDGNVGIGTTSPSYKLQVSGTIRATSFLSDTTTYADFVFDDDYDLMPLSGVEAHIEEYGHLPDIPSETEAMANGIDLAAMQVRLLQKIEELTLHVIRQEKSLTLLSEENQDLRSEIQTMKGRF